MEKRVVDGERSIPSHDQPKVIADPSEGAHDNPARPETAQGATVLRRRLAAAATVARDQFDVTPRQPSPQKVAIIALVGDYLLKLLTGPTRSVQSGTRIVASFFSANRTSTGDAESR